MSGAKLDRVWADIANAHLVVAFRDPLGDGLPRRGGPGGVLETSGERLGRLDATCLDMPDEPR